MRSVNKKSLILALLLILGLTALFFYFRTASLNKNGQISTIEKTPTIKEPVVAKDEKYLWGTISSISNNLPVDGNCEAIVNGQRVVITVGGDRMPSMIPKEKGSVQGISCKANTINSEFIGKHLEAYGKWNGSYLTIEGSTRYFISVVDQDVVSNKPPIVDFFACGDYCPGPPEKYTVKVYKGVTNPETCKEIGGTPSSFTGWGVTYFCLATNQVGKE